MKDLEKLKDYSLEKLQEILEDCTKEVVKPDIGYTRTRELIKDIRKLRRLINGYPLEDES